MILGNSISPFGHKKFFGGGGILPLDLYPSSIGGWSVARLLRTNYTGYCMKVRRDSDNTTLDIPYLAGVFENFHVKPGLF